MYPTWMDDLAWSSIILCVFCAALIILDIASGYRHRIAVMNWVWPLTALYLGPIAILWHHRSSRRQHSDLEGVNKPFWKKVFTAAAHSGTACVLGDIAGEWLVFFRGATIAGSVLWAAYIYDFILSFILGIVFQYSAIAPLRNASVWDGIVAALKVNTISIIAFEIGMFAFMALTREVLFPALKPNQPLFWLMMQIAMLVGLATTYPVNWWLIKTGLKEGM
jgi:hypothetical protein